MPQKTGTGPRSSTKGRPAGRAKSAAPKAVKKEPTQQRRTIVCVCVLALALFLLVSLFFNVTGVVGDFLRFITVGLFGGGAYLVPICVGYIGVIYGFLPCKLKKSIFSLLLLIIISSALHLFVPQPESAAGLVGNLFSAQSALSGGVIGGLLTCGLRALGGVVGAAIIIVAAFVCFFVMCTGITFKSFFSFFTRLDDEIEDDGEPAPASSKQDKKAVPAKGDGAALPRRDFDIDVPVPEQPLPPPEVTNTGYVPPRSPAPDPGSTGFEPYPAGGSPVGVGAPSRGTQRPAEKAATAPAPAPVAPPPPPPIRGMPPREDAAPPEPVDPLAPPTDLVLHKESGYVFPPLSLLSRPKDAGGALDAAAELQKNAESIVETLSSFGVETTVTNISRGPTVTRYELQPSVGVKISKITSLSDDLALSLAAEGVRIEAPIPGKAAVGIEVPNKHVSTVYLRDVIDSDVFKKHESRISFALGMDIAGDPVVGDIARMPHLLIAGATGSGKSVCINSLIVSILYKSTPDEVKLVMVDPKVVELAVYNGIPHLVAPVVTDPKKAAGMLQTMVAEMNRRYNLFAENGVRDLRGYNKLAQKEEGLDQLPQIVIIIDELADLMMAAPGDVEDAICRLAQMARAAGMHLVIATQRPSVDVITGIIKANIPSRIAFAVKSMVDSRTILDMGGADKLLGRGDMLYYPVGSAKPVRIQACFISDREVEGVTKFIKSSAAPEYDEELIRQIDHNAEHNVKVKGARGGARAADGDDGAPGDDMLPAAIEIAVETGSVSTSMLQRRLKLGYARAGRLMDEMEERGIVGPHEGSKPRQVLLSREQWQEMVMRGTL